MQIIQCTRFWLYALVGAFVSLTAFEAQAQSFPDKPVHIIVGVSAGGGTDFTARMLALQLTKLWGQPVIVENRPGAAGAIANEFLAKSPADGYTLLVTSDDITVLSALRSDLPYDLLHDLTSVSLVATQPVILVVKSSLPVHNVKELIALAQSEPGKLTYGSAGVGSIAHLQGALFASVANINIVHVPYKGTAAAVVGVADGEVDLSIVSPTSARGLVKAGKVRMLAVSGPQRSPLFPSVPTIGESGLPGFSITNWEGVFAPAGLPKNVLAALSAGIAKAADAPEMKSSLLKQGLESKADSPEQFTTFIHNDLDENIKLIKLAGLKAK